MLRLKYLRISVPTAAFKINFCIFLKILGDISQYMGDG